MFNCSFFSPPQGSSHQEQDLLHCLFDCCFRCFPSVCCFESRKSERKSILSRMNQNDPPNPIIPKYTTDDRDQIYKINLKVPISQQTRKVRHILRFGKLPAKRPIEWAAADDVQAFSQYLRTRGTAMSTKRRRVTPHPRAVKTNKNTTTTTKKSGISFIGASSPSDKDGVQEYED